jgi:5-formyltetrahydrofolate cyclo-ligase
MKACLKNISSETIEVKSHQIADRLFQTRWWDEADTIFAFCSMPQEVETTLILTRAFEQVKTVGIPRVQGNDLVFHRLKGMNEDFCTGVFDIREPAPDWPVLDVGSVCIGKLLVVTPGLAFDREKNRLGRGKGFYDRFFSQARAYEGGYMTAVGMCFAEQLIAQVPVGSSDIPVDGIITEQETVY